MSRNTHEPNASPAHGLDQANHISRVGIKACCSCELDTLGSVNGRCLLCDHRFCEMCSVNFSGDARPALPLTDEAHRVLPTPQHMPISTPIPPRPLLAMTSESNQPQNLANREERDPPGKARNEVNEQEHEARPHRETPEAQYSSTIPKGKKRKLNTEKCQRCREDKKGCTWKSSEKCDRCIEKGFPCSERTRVIRPRKRASKHVSQVHNDTSPSADSDLFKERFEKWAFLKSYHKMMTMATDRVRELEKDVELTFHWFTLPWVPEKTARRNFDDFVGCVRDALDQALGEIITIENGLEAFAACSLTEGQRLALFVGPPDTMCVECCPEHLEPTIIKAIESLDVCGAFLAQQHFFQEHSPLFNPDLNGKVEKCKSRELERYIVFSTEIPRQAGAVLGSSDPSYFGLYHFDVDWLACLEWKLTSIDCLGRTPLHRSLDSLFKYLGFLPRVFLKDIFNEDIVETSWWNSQDILGRTPLHVLCQFRDLDVYSEDLRRLLREEANPGLETIYGSLPLHYVAANGSSKSCKLLLEHKDKFNIGTQDKKGRTALEYAILGKHSKVADLLVLYYAEAGLSREIEETLRLKELIGEVPIYY